MIIIKKIYRKLDNIAKAFSLDSRENKNIFRLTILLKGKVDFLCLKKALNKTLEKLPYYKVKIKKGFFWDSFSFNEQKVIVKEESDNNISLENNFDYSFKVSYFDNKIFFDFCHILTDGKGAITFLKEVMCNYFNLKYDIGYNKKYSVGYKKNININSNEKKYKLIEEKAYLINDESILYNKNYYYVLNLEELKNICKNKKVSITEYLCSIYILAIYNSLYDKNSKNDIIINVPIDLRKYYNVQTLSNFFTCMNVKGNVVNNKNINFHTILKQVHNEFKHKTNIKNVNSLLKKDIDLGNNVFINLAPLFLKKTVIKYFGKVFSKSSTATLSNIGIIDFEEKYKKYIDNIIVSVGKGRFQKIKCTICSFDNNLTVTINSSLKNNSFKNEFSYLLKKYIGNYQIML